MKLLFPLSHPGSNPGRSTKGSSCNLDAKASLGGYSQDSLMGLILVIDGGDELAMDGHECCGRVKDTETINANTNVKAMSASAGA
jgi:hypothetical protein